MNGFSKLALSFVSFYLRIGRFNESVSKNQKGLQLKSINNKIENIKMLCMAKN